MSPRPAAPSRASVMAWSTTSASLWPARPRVVRNCDSAEHDRAIAGKGVDVEAHAGARSQPSGQPLLGAREIGGGGELVERGIALDGGDAHAGGAQRPSFRRSGSRRSIAHRPAVSASSRKAWGVWTRTRPPRSTGSPSWSAARARVSPTGRTGAAPSKNSSGASSRSITPVGQKGRAASWTSTASPSIASSPARTESARSAPPSMNRPTSRPCSAAARQLLLALADHDAHAADRRVAEQALRPPSAAPACRRSAGTAWARRRRGVRLCRRRR